MSVLKLEYSCSEGHYHATNEPMERCPCYTHGSPCKGELKRIGRGSRKAKGAK